MPYSCSEWGEAGSLDLPPIVDDGLGENIVFNWFENPNGTNIYPLIVFLDHTMSIDRILGTNPAPTMANLIIQNLIENLPGLSTNKVGDYELTRYYPNPFNPILNMDFQLEKSGFTKVEVYDLKGNLIDGIYSGFLQKGKHQFVWDGEEHPSGTYFISFSSKESTVSTSIVLLK